MNKKEIAKDISKNLSKYRMRHSVGVMNTSKKLAKIYGCSIERAELAGLLHDCGKYFNDNDMIKKAKELGLCISITQKYAPDLLHGPVGAEIAKSKYEDLDIDMYNSIFYHTTGRPNMSKLEKIVYVADLIEPFRNYPEVDELRDLVGINLDLLVVKIMDRVINSLIRSNKYIDPKTVLARNYIYHHMKKD
ncbi:MAG: bis(5'-nucleosyl)-tetraphosphatase (symmetrical) YqeK [Clostridia bacterium]